MSQEGNRQKANDNSEIIRHDPQFDKKICMDKPVQVTIHDADNITVASLIHTVAVALN